MVEEVAGDARGLRRTRTGCDHVAAGPHFHLLGTSGTVTTLAGVHSGCRAMTAGGSTACGWTGDECRPR